jgi:two-component system phosphate regulon response regulator PhoB
VVSLVVLEQLPDNAKFDREAREQLLDAVWGRDIHVEPRTVDVHIRRLRKAINQDHEVDLIRTVRSAGYALDSDPNRLG